MKFLTNIFFFSLCTFSNFVYSDEIIQDQNGNYFLMKDDGTFIKLPKPKPGNKYVIKKKNNKKKSQTIFKKPEKKAEEPTRLDR